MNYLRIALVGLTLAGAVGFNTAARAQDITGTNIIALTDFDMNIPGWDYGYFYSWGWGPDGQYADGTWLVNRFYDDTANGGTLCMRYEFTNSPLYQLVATNSGAGYGTGFGGPQAGWGWDPSVFNTIIIDPTNYLFEFDARAEGLADGVTTGDCEMQVQIGGSGGVPKYLQASLFFNPGSNWTRFSFSFEDASFTDGTTWQNFTNNLANIVEVRFNVNLHMPHPQFGWDDYNVVLIDNLQLAVRQFAGPPPPTPPTVPLTILEWNMDDKPLWYTYGGILWSQNSYFPSFDYYRNDGPNTVGVGGSTAWWISMTNTDLAPPNTPQWAGGGTGGGGPVDFTKFTDNEVKRYIVSFDARVEGLDSVNYPDVTNTTVALQLFMDSPNGNVRLDFPVPADSNWVHTVASFNAASWNTGDGRLPKSSFSTNYNTYTAIRMQWQIENAANANWGYDTDNLIAVDNIKVVHEVIACPPLTITTIGADEVVSWADPNTGTAKLQGANSVTGAWSDVLVGGNPATSPYTNAVANAPKYYRTLWVPPPTP